MNRKTLKVFKNIYIGKKALQKIWAKDKEIFKALKDKFIHNYEESNFDFLALDDFDFLALIASSNYYIIKKIYFNEKTMMNISESCEFQEMLCRYNFFPNKIKFFDNVYFLKSLTVGNNTYYIVNNISNSIKKHSDEQELVDTLKNGLYKLIDYLKQDFIGNIKNISIFMEKLPDIFYKEFLSYISDNLKQIAIENKEMTFDEIFHNSYLLSFKEIEIIINNFKGINNLYYSPSLIRNLIDKTSSFLKGLVINDQEKDRLKNYIFNDYCKAMILKNLDNNLLEKLYMCFSNKVILYLLDDIGLKIIDENNKINELFSNNIPLDKLTESKIFAKLLIKKYSVERSFFDDDLTRTLKRFSCEESLFNLLNTYIESKDYNYFFRIFTELSGNAQDLYYKNNFEKILELNNDGLFKGMKKEVYEMFKDKVDIKKWTFSDSELYAILKNKESYSKEQLEYVFSNKENIHAILNSEYIDLLYEDILNLNISKLNKIYMSEEVLNVLRNLNKLDKIYKTISKLEIDIRPLLLNTNCLISVGEKVLEEYKIVYYVDFYKLPTSINNSYYGWFLLNVPNLKDTNVLFEILDFYLTNSKYLSTFYILKYHLENEVLKEYLNSRKDLITEIVKENSCDLNLILGNLPNNIRKNEFFKERENIAIYLDELNYFKIFHDDFNGQYRLDEKILKDERFILKFICSYQFTEESLRLVTDNEKLIKELVAKIDLYNDMKNKILRNLNDYTDEFKEYLQILMNSNVNIYEIEFLKDMADCIFFNKRIKEVYFKYKDMNLNRMKWEILSNVIKKSRENIASSLTNPLDKNIVYIEYTLNGEKVLIPTIIYDNENYTFLARRMETGKHFYDGSYRDKIESYSTITEKNRSMLYGDFGLKVGYIKVNPEDIIHINSFDSICLNPIESKYTELKSLKFPEWISMEELNERTLKRGRYNELRIKGKHIPDFVISYDEPDEKILRYSYEHNVPLVKILRKSYPNAIEHCDDPYGDWN